MKVDEQKQSADVPVPPLICRTAFVHPGRS
jgi:hypothetical protein